MFKHKKIVSILILAAMLLTLLPTAGFAETLDIPGDTTEIVGGGSTTTEPTEETTPNITDTESGSDQGDPDTTDTDNTHNNGDSDAGNTGNTVTEGNEGTEEDDVEKDEIIQEDVKEDTAVIGTAALLSAKMEKAAQHELTLYHILTTDGKPAEKGDANYIYEYKIEHLLYEEGYKFPSFENMVNGTLENLPWEKYWQAPQSNWVLTDYKAAFNNLTMPVYNTNIELYYKLDVDPADVRYSVYVDSFQIMVDDQNPRHAFCLDHDRINPATYTNIPYKPSIPFSKVADQYNSVSEKLITNVLLVGYPCDALGLQEQYNLPNADAEFITQLVIWDILNNTDAGIKYGFGKAIYDAAKNLTDNDIIIDYKDLALADGLTSLHFIEQDNGVFATEPVSIQGYNDQYSGTITLSLPNTMKVYTTEGAILDPAQLPINEPIIFTSSTKPTIQSIDANYTYHTPNELYFYEAYIQNCPWTEADNAYISNINRFQNLVAYDINTNTIETSFPITVSIKATPLEPSVPTPVDPEPTPTPDNNGGGGDYTPDTPSTPDEPNTPSTPVEPAVPETIIPDETTPLAPAPEIVPETEAEVTLDEEPVPLAPAAPVSDNPKTGHLVNVIFILQACLLLAAAALLLNDLRQYKKAQ